MTAFMVDRDIDAAKVLADRYMRSWRSNLPLYLDGTIASIEAILSGGRPDWKRELIAPARSVASSAG